MAKKKSTTSSSPVKTTQTVKKQPAHQRIVDNLGYVFCILYIGVHFVPLLGSIDIMGPQWFYLSVLDLLVAIYILIQKAHYQVVITSIFKNRLTHLYLALLLYGGISFFFSLNKTEMLVCYARLATTTIAFLNLTILFKGKIDHFKILALLLTIILLGESIYVLKTFFDGINNTEMSELILTLKGNTGNKNIMAASLVLKIPFCFYGIYRGKIIGKMFNILTLIMGVLAISIINARSAYLGLLLVSFLYFIFCILTHLKNKKTTQTIYHVSYVLLPLIVGFLLSQLILSNAQSLQESKSGYGTVAERLGTIRLSNDASSYRFKLWEHAGDYIIKHPIMGCGIGNWKLASIPYEKEFINDLNVPAHSHNDFLEMATEVGIPGGLLYLGIFICLLIYTVKTWLSHVSEEVKLVSVFSLMALAGYFTDAFFNFPGERPVMQMFFALVLALNVTAFNKTKPTEDEKQVDSNFEQQDIYSPLFALGSITFLLPAIYITYFTFQSLIAQNLVIPDLLNEPLKVPLDEVKNLFPPIPNLSASAQPLDGILGRYYYENKQYEKALQLLNKGEKANPYVYYTDFLKAGVYFKMNKFDSADKYAKKSFYNRPRANTFFQTFVAIEAQRKDTAEITKGFNTYIKYRDELFPWNIYLMGMLNAKGAGDLHLLKLVDSALKKFPIDNNQLLQRRTEIVSNMNRPIALGNPTNEVEHEKEIKYMTEGNELFGKGDLVNAAIRFLKGGEINPKNYVFFENAGICYFNLKEYQKAINCFNSSIKLQSSVSGKSEFFKGCGLINLGNKTDGCVFLQIAKTKNYKDAEGIINSNCKQ